jgi:hypothetical protein
MINVSVHMSSQFLKVADLDKAILRKGLRRASRIVQQTSKRLITPKRRSKPGEYPGRDTGLMRRNVKVVVSKRPGKFWARVQVSTLPNSFFYPAVLSAGRKDHKLLSRKNFIGDAQELTKNQTEPIIRDAIRDSLKVWGK